MTREVKIVSYDGQWPKLYQREVTRLHNVLGREIVSAHHIGSTAIPGMSAKPIIDILLEVKSISKFDDYNDEMIGLGYNPRGELGIPGRRYFSRDEDVDVRTHHVHAFQSGNIGIERHLAFRDYMITHSDAAREYAHLKMKLARAFQWDIAGYCEGKESFVDDIEKKAILWYRSLKTRSSNP
ncbi:MAG: GrpB family protein [Candidatus Thorarchaeota archaeon]